MGLLLNIGLLTILLSGEVHVQKQRKQQLFVRIVATQIADNGGSSSGKRLSNSS